MAEVCIPLVSSEKFCEKGTQTEEKIKQKNKETYAVLEKNDDSYTNFYHGETGGDLFIEIEDTGIGINEEDKKKLFNPFVQANVGISKVFGGTGLGLYVSKVIMQAYGGDINLTSTLNKGSKFIINQPCTVCIDCESPSPKRSVYNNLEVLLIDNQHTKLNKSVLEEQGIKVLVCMSDIPAVKYLKSSEFKIIFIGFNFITENSAALMNLIKKLTTDRKSSVFLLVPESISEIPNQYKFYNTIKSPISYESLISALDSSNKCFFFKSELVLIVDDDLFILNILSKMLEKEKIRHLTCAKGKELIGIYQEKYKEVAVIVLDANLEDISGFQVAQSIRAFERKNKLGEVPIICVSGDSDKEHHQRCKDSEINTICKKLFSN